MSADDRRKLADDLSDQYYYNNLRQLFLALLIIGVILTVILAIVLITVLTRAAAIAKYRNLYQVRETIK